VWHKWRLGVIAARYFRAGDSQENARYLHTAVEEVPALIRKRRKVHQCWPLAHVGYISRLIRS